MSRKIVLMLIVLTIGIVIGVCAHGIIGETVRDVSYSELVRFLDKDETHMNKFDNGVFECTNFSITLRENANNAGIRCALVYIDLTQFYHMINGFNTTDKGMVYYDAQFAKFVSEPLIGAKHLVLLSGNDVFDAIEFGDGVVIEKVHLIW